MFCRYFHREGIWNHTTDLDTLEKREKIRDDRLNVKSGHYPWSDFKHWEPQDKWRYFGNYVIFGDWKQIEERKLMSKWHKILWDQNEVSYDDVFLFMELSEEFIDWLVKKRVTELQGYYFVYEDCSKKTKKTKNPKQFWLTNVFGDEKYIFNLLELDEVRMNYFPEKVKHVRCNSCLKLYYSGYPGSETLLCDICCWQWISQLSLSMKISRITNFLDKCWLKPKTFESDNKKRLEKRITKQMKYFIQEMSKSDLHFYGNKLVQTRFKQIQQSTCGEKLPKKFEFITMCKDEEMDIDKKNPIMSTTR